MAVNHIVCGDGATLVITNNGEGEQQYFRVENPAGDSPQFFKLQPDQMIQFPCTGVTYIEDNGYTATGYLVVPLPSFPVADTLLGLAGILSGFLIAMAFRGSR